ncbi:MAG: hypothetical protein Q9O62_06140 [Ardenticatenia bacterium]|nr:hypothetical protein [Ardenticatenia bacterium]
MPAISTRLYILTREAAEAGLRFDVPPWWDLERLFELNADRRVRLPDGREVMLIGWTRILTYDLRAGKKVWARPGESEGQRRHGLPEKQSLAEAASARRQALLEALQDARWLIVGRTRVWMVPERARPGCAVFREPYWWEWGHTRYRAFWSRHWQDRFFEEPNPVYLDYVGLFTGEEIRALDESTREPFWAWWREQEYRTRDRETWLREEMARLEEALQGASWVAFYRYEWESGLS